MVEIEVTYEMISAALNAYYPSEGWKTRPGNSEHGHEMNERMKAAIQAAARVNHGTL